MDPNIFPDPSRFDPTRYVRGEYGPHGEKMQSFGIGPRMCVGYRLAEAEVVCLLAHVLTNFHVGPGDVPPVEESQVSLQPKSGLFLRLKPLA